MKLNGISFVQGAADIKKENPKTKNFQNPISTENKSISTKNIDESFSQFGNYSNTLFQVQNTIKQSQLGKEVVEIIENCMKNISQLEMESLCEPKKDEKGNDLYFSIKKDDAGLTKIYKFVNRMPAQFTAIHESQKWNTFVDLENGIETTVILGNDKTIIQTENSKVKAGETTVYVVNGKNGDIKKNVYKHGLKPDIVKLLKQK